MGRRPTSAARPRLALFGLLAILALGVLGCGGGERQDANEPTGNFEVDVTTSKFPTSQRIAQTSDFILGVKNTGKETLPELAFTITTDDESRNDDGGVAAASTDSQGSFSIRDTDPNLADPATPVWILENKYPREVDTPPPTGLSPGFRAQTNTFGFGELEPGDEREIVFRLTPVMPGTYTLRYLVEAGLDGKARAVTADGGEVKGEFVVTITDKPPKASVDENGNVVTEGN